jgi:hypothetical protein
MNLEGIVNAIELEGKQIGLRAMAGGSYALKNVYGVLNRPTDDIDIILTTGCHSKNEEDSVKVFSILEKLFPLDTITTQMECYSNAETYINAKVECVLDNEKVMVNFIMNKNFSWKDWCSQVFYKGVRVIPLMRILEAKGGYNRDKDKLDLFSITQKITAVSKNIDSDELPF